MYITLSFFIYTQLSLILIPIILFFIFKEQINIFLTHVVAHTLRQHNKAKRPKRIILIRHGQSEANIDPELYKVKPDNKIRLTEKGRQQAREAGKRLKEIVKDESIRFYVSSYQRTRETYEGLLESLKENKGYTTFDNRIREQEYGNLQSDMDRQFKDMNKVGELYYRFKGGENGADVFNRACLFTEHLFREIESIEYKKRDNVIIVTHDLFIRLFMLNFLNSDLDVYMLNNIRHPENCEFWIIEKNDKGRFKIKSQIFESNSSVPPVPCCKSNNPSLPCLKPKNSSLDFLRRRKSVVDLPGDFSDEEKFLDDAEGADFDCDEEDTPDDECMLNNDENNKGKKSNRASSKKMNRLITKDKKKEINKEENNEIKENITKNKIE